MFKKVNDLLWHIEESVASRLSEILLPRYTALVMSDLECCLQFWAHHLKKDRSLTGLPVQLKMGSLCPTQNLCDLELLSWRLLLDTFPVVSSSPCQTAYSEDKLEKAAATPLCQGDSFG